MAPDKYYDPESGESLYRGRDPETGEWHNPAQDGDYGGWGLRGQFHSEESPARDPRYADNHYNPNAYFRVLMPEPYGWKTFRGGIPIHDPGGFDLEDAIADLLEDYEKFGLGPFAS